MLLSICVYFVFYFLQLNIANLNLSNELLFLEWKF